jgi:hypothetical protein
LGYVYIMRWNLYIWGTMELSCPLSGMIERAIIIRLVIFGLRGGIKKLCPSWIVVDGVSDELCKGIWCGLLEVGGWTMLKRGFIEVYSKRIDDMLNVM